MPVPKPRSSAAAPWNRPAAVVARLATVACGRRPCRADRDDPTVHETSCGTYGALRVHAEPRVGLGLRCGARV
jgi:hypothetical protein